jgi:type IV secretory pathway TrbF-like protein
MNSDNPYASGNEGRKEWNDRYMNMSKSIKNWQIAFGFTIFTVIILVLVIAKLATSSRVQPFVVETNNGMPYAVQPLSSISLHDEKLINFASNQFIMNARTILNDAAAQKSILDKVYAYAADEAIAYLHDYYQQNNPLELNQKYTVSIDIINSMPLGNNSCQVIWDETKRDQSGSLINKTRWMANLTYQFGQVNSKFMNDNPFGFYVTQLSWSQSSSE